MRLQWLLVGAASCVASGVLSPACAEDQNASGARALPSKFFAGYSFVTSDQEGSLHGGALALDVGLTRSLALVLNASKHWGGHTHMDESNFMIGPALFLGSAVQPFAQALIGIHTLRGDKYIGVGIGGGADVALGSRWSLRGEADYLWSHQAEPQIAGVCAIGVPDCFGSAFTENGLRLSMGVVYAWGR